MHLSSIRDAYNQIHEGYTDPKYDPDKMGKELKRDGVSYGKLQHLKGDDARRPVQAKLGDKTVDTDLGDGGYIGGGVQAGKGKAKYSPSWGAGHRKVKTQLDRVGRAIDDTQASDAPSRKKPNKDKSTKTAVGKMISDISGVGRKTNVQGKGNKAYRRIGEENWMSLSDRKQAMLEEMGCASCGGGGDMGGGGDTNALTPNGFQADANPKGPQAGFDKLLGKVMRKRRERRGS